MEMNEKLRISGDHPGSTGTAAETALRGRKTGVPGRKNKNAPETFL